MTIRLLQDRYVNGAVASAGTVHNLDLELESFLVQQGFAQWEGVAPTFLNSPTAMSISNGSAHVIDGVTQVPRTPVLITIDDIPTRALRKVAGGTSQEAQYCRVVVNPGDPVIAADDLAEFAPGVERIGPEESVTFATQSGTPITDVYVLVVGNAAQGAAIMRLEDSGGTSVGALATFNDTAADLIADASIVHFEIGSDEDCRSVTVSMSELLSAGEVCEVVIKGDSYAQ